MALPWKLPEAQSATKRIDKGLILKALKNLMKHKHPHLQPVEWRPVNRLFLAVFAVLVIGAGSFTLASGKLHYQNYWGGYVFSPFAIAVGIVALIAAIRGKPFKRS